MSVRVFLLLMLPLWQKPKSEVLSGLFLLGGAIAAPKQVCSRCDLV